MTGFPKEDDTYRKKSAGSHYLNTKEKINIVLFDIEDIRLQPTTAAA